MKKILLISIILLSLIMPLTVYSQTINSESYTKVSYDQAKGWLQSISLDELIDYVINWDYIEHSQLNIPEPQYSLMILDNGDINLIPYYTTNEIPNLLYGTATLGYLSYSIQYPVLKYEKVIKKPFIEKAFPYIIGSVFIGGVIVGVLVAK